MISGENKVGDIQLYYEIRGDGYPLVMIQGLTANSAWWPPELLDFLAKDYKVITFDNRGAGRSSRTDDHFNMETMADDAIGLMEALGVEKAHVLGISMGGMIAQELVLKYPQRVNKLILCATAPGGQQTVLNPEVISEMAQSSMLPPAEREKFTLKILFTEQFIDENPPLIEAYLQRLRAYLMDPAYIIRQIEAVVNFSSFDRLCEIKSPTLVLVGDEDPLLPPANSKVLAENIPGARLKNIEGASHAVMADINNFIPLVLEFLQ